MNHRIRKLIAMHKALNLKNGTHYMCQKKKKEGREIISIKICGGTNSGT